MFGNSFFFPSAQNWTPASITTALWLDGADSSSVVLNGPTVAQWKDKSGNNRHATQGTAANQPTYTTNGLNGKPVITFDGVNDVLNTPVFQIGDVVVTVARRTVTSSPIAQIGTHIYRGLWGDYSMGFTTHAYYAVNGNNFVNSMPNSAFGANTFIVSQKTRLIPFAAPLDIGFGSPSYTYLNGHIAEMVSLSSFTSDSDIRKVEGYLAWKWGLQANLPSDHPYKNSAPTV